MLTTVPGAYTNMRTTLSRCCEHVLDRSFFCCDGISVGAAVTMVVLGTFIVFHSGSLELPLAIQDRDSARILETRDTHDQSCLCCVDGFS